MNVVRYVGGCMWRMVAIFVFISGCTRGPLPAASGSGLTAPVPTNANVIKPTAITAHRLTQGEVLFLRHCAGCHGATARGDGPVGTLLEIHPRNLRQAGLFTDDTEPAWVNRILYGYAMPVSVQSSKMILKEEEIDLIIAHLRRLPTLPWSEIGRGERVYDSLCLSCHGIYGHGDGPLEKTLPAPPRDLVTPMYQQQVTDETLFQIVSVGKGAMPGAADVLSVDDRKAVVAFVRLLTPGYEIYDRYCAACHGHKGRPVSQEVLEMLGQEETWEQPPAFDEAFFRTRTDEQLRKGVSHMLTLNRVAMPHFAGELTAEQVRQVLSYLRTLPPES